MTSRVRSDAAIGAGVVGVGQNGKARNLLGWSRHMAGVSTVAIAELRFPVKRESGGGWRNASGLSGATAVMVTILGFSLTNASSDLYILIRISSSSFLDD